MKALSAVLIFLVGGVLGAGIGMMVASEPADNTALEAAEQELRTLRAELDSLKRQAAYASVARPGNKPVNLDAGQVKAFNKQMNLYISGLRKRRYLGVSDAFRWFQGRWVEVLEAYSGGDGRRARAEVLAQLLVSVRSSIDPNDFITWQVEWLSASWLLEVQTDIDGDGLPSIRRGKAQSVELTSTSACQAAMELNLLVRDAIVMVDHSLPCNEGAPRVSGLLAGGTYGKVLDSFVKLMRESGYVVVDKTKGKVRRILLGAGR